MKFIDLLNSDREMCCNLIIGDVDMPATLCWDEEYRVTSYSHEKFKCIMDALYIEHDNGTIEVLSDDDKMGELFSYASAGYISEDEYNKMFVVGEGEMLI